MISVLQARTLRALTLVGLVACAGAAHAHVVLDTPAAPAGSHYKAIFKVSHGCGASPTRQVSVRIPAGVRSARPMPKPGWTLEVAREPLAVPFTSHGRTIVEDVVRLTWTARTADDLLQSAHYDEFVLVAQLPAAPGVVHWPVSQVCQEGRVDWVEVPRADTPSSGLKSPAPALKLLAPIAPSGHRH